MTLRLHSLVILLGLLLSNTVHAADELRTGLSDLAAQVSKYMQGQDLPAGPLALGDFRWEPEPAYENLQVTTAAGFKLTLAEELQKLGLPVSNDARFSLAGTYSTTELVEDGARFLGLSVNLTIVDGLNNESQFQFKRKIGGEAALVKGLGLNVSLKPDDSRSENDRAVRRALLAPSYYAAGNEVRNDKASPFGLEILVGGRSRDVRSVEGRPIVDIDRGETYAVKIYNRSPHEVAVQILIDGISMFAFGDPEFRLATGEPRYSVVIVPAARGAEPGTVMLEGWHRNNKPGGQDRFVVTEYSQSAAGKLMKVQDLGTITATFQACWDKNQPIPPTIAATEPGRRRGGLGDATGFGAPIGEGFREVQRAFGVIRESISVRYTTAK